MRAIEFYAGIGGFATAARRVWQGAMDILPIDIDLSAKRVYELNHSHEVLTSEIGSLSASEIGPYAADLWWLSPPCQPYSRRGHQHDIEDPRAASLIHLIRVMEAIRPNAIALENVEGFADSRVCELLVATLVRNRYFVKQRLICPTELGWPNRRPRFYLLASLEPIRQWDNLPVYDRSVAEMIRDIAFDPAPCRVDEVSLSRFASGMDRVDPANPECITSCFGSSYGKSLLRAGSYCKDSGGYRRFAPTEVAKLLGYPESFLLPDDLSYRRQWKLLGNSLSIPVVEYLLRHVPGV